MPETGRHKQDTSTMKLNCGINHKSVAWSTCRIIVCSTFVIEVQQAILRNVLEVVIKQDRVYFMKLLICNSKEQVTDSKGIPQDSGNGITAEA